MSGPTERIVLCPESGGPARPLPGSTPGDVPSRFSEDGRRLFVFKPFSVPVQVETIDVASGARAPWRLITPPETAGLIGIVGVVIGRGEKTLAYSAPRILSELHLVEGLH